MPNYYLGAADCQWFCLRLLYRIMGTGGSVSKILESAKMEGAKMFREKDAPLTRAQAVSHDIARVGIRTAKAIKGTVKAHSEDGIPVDMRQLVLEIITGNKGFTTQVHTECDSHTDDYNHHPHHFDYHDWKNIAKHLTTIVVREVHEYEQKHHSVEWLRGKATKMLHHRHAT